MRGSRGGLNPVRTEEGIAFMSLQTPHRMVYGGSRGVF